MMSSFNCGCKFRCTTVALVAAAIIGVLAAFLQITGVITVTTLFAAVAFGIAVVYLGILLLQREGVQGTCPCGTVRTLLAGILGTILLALILLAVGIIATSVFSAILVGLLLFFFALMTAAAACYVTCRVNCDN